MPSLEKRICVTGPIASEAVSVSVTVGLKVEAVLLLMTTVPVGAWLSTVTLTRVVIVVLPEVSRARAPPACARPVGCGRRVPRQAVGRGGVLAAERIAVEQELHAGDCDVVGGRGGQRHRAGEIGTRSGSCPGHARRDGVGNGKRGEGEVGADRFIAGGILRAHAPVVGAARGEAGNGHAVRGDQRRIERGG